MIDKKRISENLKYIKAMNENGASPPLDEYWDEIVNMLSLDLEETKKYLRECKEHEIKSMTGYFDDISYNLQDKSFIEFLYQLQSEHPNIDMNLDIQQAKYMLED